MTHLHNFNGGIYQKVQDKWVDSDKDSPLWQFVTLIVKPNSVFKHIVTHKHETSLWPRGNIKFLLTELFFLILSIPIWFLFRLIPFNFQTFISGLFSYIIIDYGVIGSLISTVFWKCLNKWRIITHSYRESKQDVEWKYCADAFHNGMVAVIFDFVYLFPLLSLICKIHKSSVLLNYFLPNSLFCIAICHGIYLMISSLNVLAFIKRMNYMYFIAPVFMLFIILFTLRIDIVSFWISYHFRH